MAGYFQLAAGRPGTFFDRKLADHREFTAAMAFALGPVAALLWIWDYVIDPVGAQHTIGLRLACFLVGIIPGFIVLRVRNRHVVQAAIAVALLSAVTIFSAIITRLSSGMVYGIGGYMFFALGVILVSQAFSAEFGIGLAVVAAALPQGFALLGLMPGFSQSHYSVLLWPEVAMSSVALLALSYNYSVRYDAQMRLELVSTIDPLTEAVNRRLFVPLLEKEMARSKRFGHPLSLLMIDVDQFKAINDEHGHLAGDLVLEQLARTCRATVRDSDTLARLGGDEFAILLPETDSSGALELAEQLRASMESSPVARPDGHLVRYTASFGVAQARDTDLRETALIARADEALYEAKQSGRNRVCGEHGAQHRLPIFQGMS